MFTFSLVASVLQYLLANRELHCQAVAALLARDPALSDVRIVQITGISKARVRKYRQLATGYVPRRPGARRFDRTDSHAIGQAIAMANARVITRPSQNGTMMSH